MRPVRCVVVALVTILAACSSSADTTTTTTAAPTTTLATSTTTTESITTTTTTTTSTTTTVVPTTILDFSKYDDLNVETLSGTTSSAGLFTTMQDMTQWGNGFGWGGLAQLFVGSQLGDWIEFIVPIKVTGRYEIEVWLTRAPDFGIVRVTIDGVDIDDVDLYAPDVEPTTGLSMGEFDLDQGPHTVRFTVLGKSPQSTGTSFGIDTITVIGPL